MVCAVLCAIALTAECLCVYVSVKESFRTRTSTNFCSNIFDLFRIIAQSFSFYLQIEENLADNDVQCHLRVRPKLCWAISQNDLFRYFLNTFILCHPPWQKQPFRPHFLDKIMQLINSRICYHSLALQLSNSVQNQYLLTSVSHTKKHTPYALLFLCTNEYNDFFCKWKLLCYSWISLIYEILYCS